MTHAASFPPPGSAGAGGEGRRAIGFWLLTCCAMVFSMVVIGGVTRLTHSGLSMVEWKPLIGVLPPLSDAEWLRVFGLYQLSPEYRILNQGMSLAEFQGIFWWEWFHRFVAHLVGLVYVAPFLWFWARGRIDRPLMVRLIGLFVLGGMQGLMGWLMVASGLVDRPSVSHYRLAAHLSFAAAIYCVMLWQALSLLQPKAKSGVIRAASGLRLHLTLALSLSVVVMAWGAFVAGLHAGLIYNTFPLMNGDFLPGEAWFFEPTWINAFENQTTVQFFHRWLAISTAVVILLYCVRVRGNRDASRRTRRIANLLGLMVVLQVGLGISTLLFEVPVSLATAHQAGAFVLLALLIWGRHDLRRR
ncbi:Heme A synthase [Azospirillaceae bacterium]